MNYLEFAQKVKAKYPDYSDMDDRELAEKMVAKYPDDYSDVTFDATVPLRGAEPEGMKYTPSWEGKVTGQPEPKKEWSKGIFPTAGDIPKEGWGKVIRPLMGTAEGLDVLKRGLAHITGQGDIKDPEANIWAKPRQALRNYLEKKKGEVGEEKTTYTIGLPPQYGGVQTRTITKKEDLEFQKQMGDALFDIVGDPLIVKNMITGIFKQIGKISPKKIVGAGARGLTKIPEETLTKYSTKKGRLEMAKSYGKEAATGDAMVRQVYKQKLPEEALVNTFIEQADDIPLKPIIDKLEEAKKGIKFKKTNQDAINAIDNLIEDYTQYGKKVTQGIKTGIRLCSW
jgi:hypothetical protein